MTDGPPDAPEPDPQDHELADRLRSGRPVPGAGFRGALGRHLIETDPGYGPRPESLRMVVAASIAGGCGLIAVGVLQATGVL
jgi:hypothetical protein